MVIQSLNNSYSPIPDHEDVTPVDGSLVKLKKRIVKHFKVFCMVFVIITFMVVWLSNSPIEKKSTLEIYCTSSGETGRMRLLSLDDVATHLSGISSLQFNNIRCKGKQCDSFNVSSVGHIFIDPSTRYQEVLGFGGAFTEATAHNFFRLPVKAREQVLQSYFGSSGIGLTFGRIHINSCDFSIKSYDFDSVDKDYDLQFFDNNVTHDLEEIIPLIREAMEASPVPIKIVASPWSPPAWMKKPHNGKHSMLGSVDSNCLLQDDRIHYAWAKYFSKFISAYASKNVPIWAVTPQNEPEFPAPWEACSFNATSEADFIHRFLGPVLRADHPDVKLLAFDHNKDHIRQWAELLLSTDHENYIDGMAFHWYGGEDRMTDGTYGYNNLNATHHLAPDKILLGTEACSCPGVRINDWLRAERVGHDVMFDLANFAHGWIDWNLLVDSQGGPNHLKNFCDAAIITKSDYSGIHIQPKFYYLGHFSRFVKPGYVRIASQTTGNFGYVATDANIQPGVEVGIFPCEASARQIWRFNPLYQTIELLNRANSTWLSKSKEVVMCIAHGDSNRNYFRLVDCNDNHQHLLKVQFQRDAKRVVDLDSGLCLSLAAQIFQPGALAELTPCTNPVANYQRFDYLANTGEIVSEANGFCLTAGWPYLNSIAFSGPTGESVAVVMNEAPVGTTLAIHDAKQDSSLGLWIPAHSIATLVY